MVYEGWLLSHCHWQVYSTLFFQPRGNAGKACLLSESVPLHAKCILEHFCDECNEFFPSVLGCGFILLPQCKKRSLIQFSYFNYPIPPLFFFIFLRGEEQLHVLPFMLWASSVVLFYGRGLRAASALNASPWTVRIMRKAK